MPRISIGHRYGISVRFHRAATMKLPVRFLKRLQKGFAVLHWDIAPFFTLHLGGPVQIIKKYAPGILLCFGLATLCWWLGKLFPVIGGPIFAIILGMVLALILGDRAVLQSGITFTSKKVLQYAVILLGFGMNFLTVLETGQQSLPIIAVTIAVSLLIAFGLHKLLKIPGNISTLIGVGSSICGGSAIAATAPVIKADNQEIAQSISVVFFFNLVAALIFPSLGVLLGFDTTDATCFGVFAGTAVNDTSSVTAAAATWDHMFGLGSSTLDIAVTVKLTRTLAIIPILIVLAIYTNRKAKGEGKGVGKDALGILKALPTFVFGFIIASIITTILAYFGVPAETFAPFKEASKFLIIMAMGAIGLATNLVALIKSGAKPLLLGTACWVGITVSSLLVMKLMGFW